VAAELQQEALRQLAGKYEQFADDVEAGKYQAIDDPEYMAGMFRIHAKDHRSKAEKLAGMDEDDVDYEVVNRHLEVEHLQYDQLLSRLAKAEEMNEKADKLTRKSRQLTIWAQILIIVSSVFLGYQIGVIVAAFNN
jgi:hypothetical protein